MREESNEVLAWICLFFVAQLVILFIVLCGGLL